MKSFEENAREYYELLAKDRPKKRSNSERRTSRAGPNHAGLQGHYKGIKRTCIVCGENHFGAHFKPLLTRDIVVKVIK